MKEGKGRNQSLPREGVLEGHRKGVSNFPLWSGGGGWDENLLKNLGALLECLGGGQTIHVWSSGKIKIAKALASEE